MHSKLNWNYKNWTFSKFTRFQSLFEWKFLIFWTDRNSQFRLHISDNMAPNWYQIEAKNLAHNKCRETESWKKICWWRIVEFFFSKRANRVSWFQQHNTCTTKWIFCRICSNRSWNRFCIYLCVCALFYQFFDFFCFCRRFSSLSLSVGIAIQKLHNNRTICSVFIEHSV